LRAALALTKLYRVANRAADAHAVLAPAVEGFPPTQQFPELAEAQALLAALKPLDSIGVDQIRLTACDRRPGRVGEIAGAVVTAATALLALS
jgi:hypothetical protein